MTESKRQQKVSRLLQRDLGDIFQKDTKGMFGNAFITVTGVQVSPDLGVAKASLSFMLVKDKQEMMQNINERKKEIRKILGNKIGKQVRIVPELVFLLDEGAEYASKMDTLISGLNIPEETQDEDKEEDL